MSTASLPQPGVSVIQVFQSVSPTVITPTLVPVIIGVCNQVVDVLTTTATGSETLNSQALSALPAFFVAAAATGSPPGYAGLDGLKLALSLNNGPNVDITFSGSPLSPAQVVAEVLLAFSAAGVTGFIAETVGTTQWMLRSVAADQFQSIKVVGTGSDVTAPEVLAAFGLGPDKEYYGSPTYNQEQTYIPTIAFPNPNNNIDELEFNPSTETAWLWLGGALSGSALLQIMQTQSFLESGIGLAAQVIGTVALSGLTYATQAVITGTVDLTTSGLYGSGGTLDGKTLTVNVNGAGPLSLPLVGTGNAASEVTLLAAIAAEWPALTVTTNGSHYLVLTDTVYGLVSTIAVSSTTGATALGVSGTSTGTAGTLDGLTLIIGFNGGALLTTTFVPGPNDADLINQINTVIGAVALATITTSTHYLEITTLLVGATSSILVSGGTGYGTLGLALGTYVGEAGVTAVDSGNGTALTTLLQFEGANFTSSPTSAQVIGTMTPSSVTNGDTLIIDDGTGPQTLTFESATTLTLIISQINALFGSAAGGYILASNSTSHVALTNTKLGVESIVEVIGGTALTTLGFTASTVAYGDPYKPLPGDLIYIDGASYATVVQVAPGGVTDQLKINQQVPISNNVGTAWYIVATGLSSSSLANGVTRPTPNLTIDGVGDLLIKPNIIRTTQGNASPSASAQIYIGYQAIRLDVTALATNPGLLQFSDTPTLETQLSPITSDNPLGLGLYFALLNAPGIVVTGIGVDATSGSEPDGTVDAFTRAAAFLEGYEVYAMAPLTHEEAVFQIFNTHVTFMSEPDNKGERIVLINENIPTNKQNLLVASGTNGNTTLTTNQFDTSIHNLGQLLQAQGLPGVGPYVTANGIYLSDGDGNNYNVINFTGSVLTIKTSGFLPGENDDGFYATTTLPTPLIAQAFALYVRGAPLLLPDGSPDYDNEALTVQQISQGYANRRVWSIFPDSCAATINGIEQVIDGFYMSAAICGMIGAQPPQQSFTNFPMTGFTRVIGSNNVLSNPQLNIVAAGGTYIIVQDSPGTPLYSRMALTTDMTSIETRTDSITKLVDFTAKFLRSGLRNYIGRFNITQGFLDSLGHVIQGLLGFLTESGVLIGAQLNNIIQDTSAPDTVDVDVVLDVPFPCNYIRLTLTI